MAVKEWDFDSGHLILDFTNTAEFHASQHPEEQLETYADLVSWAQAAGLIVKDDAQELLRNADRHPKKTNKAYAQALELRESVYRLLSAAARDETPDESELAAFNNFLSHAMMHSEVVPGENTYTWAWSNDGDPFHRMLWTLVREAAALITSSEIKRVGECADDRGCGYLFIDTSRNHSRRWCSMESCGNRAKAKRHYRKRTGKQTRQ